MSRDKIMPPTTWEQYGDAIRAAFENGYTQGAYHDGRCSILTSGERMARAFWAYAGTCAEWGAVALGTHCDECGAPRARDGYAAHRPLCSRYLPGCIEDADIGPVGVSP